jgi:hypothetical protein
MKRTLALLIAVSIAALVASPVVAQERFVSGTAQTLTPQAIEVGLFGPLRYGLTEHMEVQGHPLLFFVAPNARLKYRLIGTENSDMSATLGVTYPTPLLRLIAAEGAGGVLPPDRAVPHVVSIVGELAATRSFGAHLLTASAGVQVAPRFGDNELVSIDLPVVYPRTAAFFTIATGSLYGQAQGPIVGPLGYLVDTKVFVFPGAEGSFAIETGARLRWRFADRWLLQAGLLHTYGGYPFGTQGRFLPLLDLVWALRG